MRRPLAIAASLLALAACGSARDLGGREAGCTTCHGFAPASAAHSQLAGGSPTVSDCSFCHPAAVDPAGALLPEGHGSGGTACAGCHDPLPPADAHLAHVNGETYSSGFPCGSCHPAGAVSAPAHGSDGLDVSFEGAVVPRGTFMGGLCASTYCHGGGFTGGSGDDPIWTATIGCSSCHGAPPASGLHTKHLGKSGVTCATCHPGYSASVVNKAIHVDGVEQVVPLDESAADSIGSWDAGSRTCALTCHAEPHLAGMDWP